MVPSIPTLLLRLTGEWAGLLQRDAILPVCRELGAPAWRDRLRTPVTTVPVLLLQMLPGHPACRPRPHLSG